MNTEVKEMSSLLRKRQICGEKMRCTSDKDAGTSSKTNGIIFYWRNFPILQFHCVCAHSFVIFFFLLPASFNSVSFFHSRRQLKRQKNEMVLLWSRWSMPIITHSFLFIFPHWIRLNVGKCEKKSLFVSATIHLIKVKKKTFH